MDAEIRTRLLQLNPWFRDASAFQTECRRHLPSRLVPRGLNLEASMEPRRALLVVGPRQAGKSTLVWSGLAALKPHEVLGACRG